MIHRGKKGGTWRLKDGFRILGLGFLRPHLSISKLAVSPANEVLQSAGGETYHL